MLLGGADRAVQLVRDGGDDPRPVAGLALRREDGGYRVPAGRARRGRRARRDGGLRRRADQRHLAGHPREFLLDRGHLG